MNHTIRDWSKVLFIVIFMPIVVMIVYLVIGGNNSSAEVSMYMVLVVFLVFLWAVFNTLIGYTIDEKNKRISHPHFYNLLRKRIDLRNAEVHKVVGFDEEAEHSKGIGFRKYKILIRDGKTEHTIFFNRNIIAKLVSDKLAKVVPVKK